VTNPSEIASFLPKKKFQAFRKFPVKDCEDLSISPGYEGRFRLAALTPEVSLPIKLITFQRNMISMENSCKKEELRYSAPTRTSTNSPSYPKRFGPVQKLS